MTNSHKILIVILVGLVLIVTIVYGLKAGTPKPMLNSYADCVAAGGAILESYPEQCMIAGKTFTNPAQENLTQSSTTNSSRNSEQEPTQNTEWKTYVAENIGFKIQYPADWHIAEQGLGSVMFNNSLFLRTTNEELWVKNRPKLPGSFDLEKYLQADEVVIKPLKKLSISGKTAYRATVVGFGTYDIVYIYHNENVIELSFEELIDTDRDVPESVREEIIKRIKLF